MSVNINQNGVLLPIAGTGSVEYGASTVRTGTVTVKATKGESTDFSVTFSEPMSDENYVVEVYSATNATCNYICIASKSKTGFKGSVFNNYTVDYTYTLKYTAFKLHSVEGLEELENSVTDLTSGWGEWERVKDDSYSVDYSYTTTVDAEFVVNWWCKGTAGYIYIEVNEVMVHALNVGSGGVQATAFQAIHAGDTIRIRLTGGSNGINGNIKRRLHN